MNDLLERLQDMVIFKHDDLSVAQEAIDRIEKLQELVELAYGLLWHDKHNEARRLLLSALSKNEQGKGLAAARTYDEKYKPGEIPLPQPIGKAIEALEEAAKQSQWWSADEDNDTSWIKFRAAAVMLTHWAAGLGGEDAGEK